MRVEIENIASEARVWIYQADRKLNESEIKEIEKAVPFFLENWESHGNALKAAWTIQYNQFLVLAVDSSYYSPSGCSIDKSVRLIQELENLLKVNFLDKSKVAIEESDNDIKTYALNEIKQKVAEGKITENSIVFNNLVNTKGDWEQNWKIPASKSWMSRYF